MCLVVMGWCVRLNGCTREAFWGVSGRFGGLCCVVGSYLGKCRLLWCGEGWVLIHDLGGGGLF